MKSTHTDFTELTYDVQLDATARARADKNKCKRFKSPNHEKKRYKYYIPEQRLWIYADSERVSDRMLFKLKKAIYIVS